MASIHQRLTIQQDGEDSYHKDRLHHHQHNMSLLSIGNLDANEEFSVQEAGCYSLRPCRNPNLPASKDRSRTDSAEESDQSGVLVIARPKGGRRSLCMDLDEVKACYDLGFELMPCISVNLAGEPGLNFKTTGGKKSPIANWRISSPGDDPRDVKARLKVWAHAVALASTSRKGLDLYS